MSERQTLSYLHKRFAAAGVKPRTRFGQNFLIDLNLVELIAKQAQLSKRDVVLEIGTGTGSLTTILAAQAGFVVTVEIDHFLAPLAQQELARHNNVILLNQDALQNKNRIDEHVLETLRQHMAEIPGARLKLVANLPYNVATPIISNLLASDPWPSRIVATIQKELAERIIAKPRTKDYSALSIWVQCQSRAEIVRVMPASVFWPRPNVESAIIDIRPTRILRDRISDTGFFHELMRGIFIHRRKFLRSALVSATQEQLSKSDVDTVLQELNLDAGVRAEQLSVEDLIDLAEHVRERCNKKTLQQN